MFTSKIASENALVKAPKKAKVFVTSFETQKAHLLARLEQSLSDAKGRYVEGKSYSQAKPSKNWRVTKEADRLEDEVVTVYLQVGKRLVESQGRDGSAGTKHKLPSTLLVAWLEEQLENVRSLTDDGSAVAEWFKAHAKDASQPTSKKFVGRYVPELDRWVSEKDEQAAQNAAQSLAQGREETATLNKETPSARKLRVTSQTILFF